MANRYVGGERPASAAATEPSLGWTWTNWPALLRAHIDGCMLHDALGLIWTFVGEANRFVDAQKPWELNKAAKAGDEEAERRLRDVLGDLVEACRLIALAAAPFLPATAPRVLAQLGYDYPFDDDGNGGPPLLDELQWGRHAGEAGRLAAAEPLFPRLETDQPSH
jgi:methionyl-tRNA synthetase